MAKDGLNISRRVDGWFQASVELPKGPDGKRVRRSVVAKTLKELEAKRQQLLKEIEAGSTKAAPKAYITVNGNNEPSATTGIASTST